MTFALDLAAFAKKTDLRTELVVRKIVLEVAREVVEMSPVGDASYWQSPPPKGYVGGRFKGNWDYGFNASPGKEYATVDKSGAESIGRIEAGVASVRMAGNVHYLANNLPYAQRLEDGWSRQAPYGMVALTVARWQAIVDGTARSLA